mgnify:CR=1 FL=1
MALNKKFLLLWLDEDQAEHSDYFPTYEEAEDHVEYLKEEFVVEIYSISVVPES